jgi:hypothetical protein
MSRSAPERSGELFQVDLPVLQAGHQPHGPLLVAQEQVLDVGAGQFAAQRLGLLHGEDRRVLDRGRLDAQARKPREEVVGRGRRRSVGQDGGGVVAAHGRRP